MARGARCAARLDGTPGALATAMLNANQIKPNTPVVCSNNVQFAVVDHIEGSDTIKLTRDATGTHHYIPLSWVRSVDDKVHVDRPGDQAMREWKTSPPVAELGPAPSKMGDAGKRVDAAKASGDKPATGDKLTGDKLTGDKPTADKPGAHKPGADKPDADRFNADKSSAGRAADGGKSAGKPAAGKPATPTPVSK